MQRALLSVRLSHHTISELSSCNNHRIVTLQIHVASRRHIAFPSLIPHAPTERLAGTKHDELRARDRGREPQDDEDVSFSEGLRTGIGQALSIQRSVTKPNAGEPHAGSSLYGKWHNLSLNDDLMFHEFDVNRSNSDMVRQVDRPGNEHDIQLWTCLIEFAHRRMGRDGTIMIWQCVSQRRNLFKVDGPLAPRFWQLVLDAAVSDENLLQDVVSYAYWLYHTHDVRWPKIHTTVINHMLHTLSTCPESSIRDVQRATLRWHLALAPTFGPSEDEFIDMMLKHLPVHSKGLNHTLKSLYSCSTFRMIHDIVVPFLYREGDATRAVQWRRFLLSYGDVPSSLANRPFLRYLAVYFATISPDLTKGELDVAGLEPAKLNPKQLRSKPPEAAVPGQNLSYLMNRVHGETFGITEKPYNDKLGAKWFASSWVSVDFAINVIYTMGVQAIGPLSLQSIALREDGASGVLQRIEQLQQLKIQLPRSSYVQAIRHYASVGDNEALQELLESDIHPDVFDDEDAQHDMLSGCLRAGDWSTYQVVLRTRLAVSSNDRASASNRFLGTCIRQGKGSIALKTMQDMSSHRVELEPETSHMLSSFILQNVSILDQTNPSNSANVRRLLDLNVALARSVAATRFPPAVEVWQNLLYRLGREELLADLERLSFDILRLYTKYANDSEQPMWSAHMADVPSILRAELPFPKFQKLPRDLPIRHEKHPLRQIFDVKLQSSIIRWGFTYTPYNSRTEGVAADLLKDTNAGAAALPASFHFARGIRLLAMLRDGGMFIDMPKVRKQAELRLVDLYRGDGRADYKWVGGSKRLSGRRQLLRLTLAEAKKLCDEAWGKSELVSTLLELERRIEMVEQDDEVNGLKRRMEILKDPEGARRRKK